MAIEANGSPLNILFATLHFTRGKIMVYQNLLTINALCDTCVHLVLSIRASTNIHFDARILPATNNKYCKMSIFFRLIIDRWLLTKMLLGWREINMLCFSCSERQKNTEISPRIFHIEVLFAISFRSLYRLERKVSRWKVEMRNANCSLIDI